MSYCCIVDRMTLRPELLVLVTLLLLALTGSNSAEASSNGTGTDCSDASGKAEQFVQSLRQGIVKLTESANELLDQEGLQIRVVKAD